MGRKGKRVHEQSAESSTPACDYETIRLIPAQKQEATGTGSSVPSGTSAPRQAYPGRNPETMSFHRVYSALAEVSSLFDPITNHFMLSDSDEQECTRTAVFAVFTSNMSSWAPVIGLE